MLRGFFWHCSAVKAFLTCPRGAPTRIKELHSAKPGQLVGTTCVSICPSHAFTFTFSHLADAFIQSDLHMCDLQCIHILHFTCTLMAHCTSGAIRGSVSCSRTLRQGIELATFCLLNDFSTFRSDERRV